MIGRLLLYIQENALDIKLFGLTGITFIDFYVLNFLPNLFSALLVYVGTYYAIKKVTREIKEINLKVKKWFKNREKTE